MYRSLILEHLSLNMLTNLRIFDLIQCKFIRKFITRFQRNVYN